MIIYFVFIDSIVYTFDYILHNIIAIEVLMFMQYSLLKHPNIVQFLGWCHPEDTDYILLVEGTLFFQYHLILLIIIVLLSIIAPLLFMISKCITEYIKGGTLTKFLNKKTTKNMWKEKVMLCMDVAKASMYHTIITKIYYHGLLKFKYSIEPSIL